MTEIQNTAEATRNLQKYLRRLSFEESGPKRVAIDGVFEDNTRQSLISFQKSAGLEPTGVADKETWDALFSEYSALIERDFEEELSLFPPLPRDYSFGYGDRFLLVKILQLLLIELSLTYDAFENITENGIFDSDTEAAIRAFQRINLLDESGRVDRKTWSRIVREYENLDKNYS
jgi:peptidoglycan hydrolase-like protein with peptidoglycan-binding domain